MLVRWRPLRGEPRNQEQSGVYSSPGRVFAVSPIEEVRPEIKKPEVVLDQI
jgi:hypothetical protein